MRSNQTSLNRFIAISDIHFFKSKRFQEHEYLIDEFIKVVKKEKPEVVVIAGDIIDSKVNISAEQVKLVRKLFKKISDYCPIITILGNHDLNLENKTRESLVEQVIESLKDSILNPIYFYKHSGIYLQFGINWYVWSCFDDQRNPKDDEDYNNLSLKTPIDHSKYKIGLFHGAIKGCIADNGFRLTAGTDVSEFDCVDIVIAGDIHLQQSFRDNEINYCSGFIQTKENEEPYGSFLIYEWDEENENFYPQVTTLENKFSVLVRKLTDIDSEIDFGEVVYPEQLLKITYDKKKFSKAEVVEYKKQLQLKYPDNKVELKPVIQNKNSNILVDKNDESKQIIQLDFETLLKKYLERNKEALNVKDLKEDYTSVLELDKEYSKVLGTDKDFEEGDFEPEKLVINNLYSFAPKDTIIDLTQEGIIGIGGKNRSGKSTLLKIIQFVLYNSVPANTTSFKKIINKHNRDKIAFGEFYFYKNQKRYVVRREITPSKKKDSVSFELTFKQIDENENELENLTDEKRQNTEVVIQKYCGLEEMFEILSFFSAQKKQVEFVDCKNAKRLELVNKFMGLQEFEQKHDNVKDDVRVKKKLYDSEVSDFNKNLIITELEEKKDKNNQEIKRLSANIATNKIDVEQIEGNITVLNSDIGKYESIFQRKFKSSQDILNLISIKEREIQDTENSKSNKDSEIKSVLDKVQEYNQYIKDLELELTKQEELFNSSKIEEEEFVEKLLSKYNSNNQEDIAIEDLNGLYAKDKLQLERSKATLESDIKRNEKQLLIDVCNNCGKEFTEKEKEKVKETILFLRQEFNELQSKLSDIEDKEKQIVLEKQELKSIQLIGVASKQSISDIKGKISNYNLKISQLETEITKIENKYLSIDNTISNIKLDIITLETSISESKKFEQEKIEAEIKIFDLKLELEPLKEKKTKLNTQISIFSTTIGQLTQEIKNIDKQITEYKEKAENIFKLEEELRLLNIYKNTVAKDGLPLFILKEKIKDINEEINTIANQVFDFDINFMIDEDSGELSLDFTYDGDQENCDVSLASGSETFIINLCIKVGLTQLSTVPKLKTLIIDEGFGTLDKDNIEKIPVLFTSLLNYYKNIILISHLDEIKDIYTQQITLVKDSKYTEIA